MDTDSLEIFQVSHVCSYCGSFEVSVLSHLDIQPCCISIKDIGWNLHRTKDKEILLIPLPGLGFHSLNFLWGFTVFDVTFLITVAYLEYKHRRFLDFFSPKKISNIEGRIFYDKINSDLVKLKASDSTTAVWNIQAWRPYDICLI